MTTTNPTLLAMPIAKNGTKNTIPETQAAAGNGLMSQSTGFPPETALPLGAGGIAPSREDFNGAFNLLSNIAFYAQKGWTFEYDATQDYYKGCVVIDPADGNRYECIADMPVADTIAPHSDTNNDYWKAFSLGGGVPVGFIMPYAGTGLQEGWLDCDGSAVSRTMYPDLFAAIGTTWGAGDGSTTFNLPHSEDLVFQGASATNPVGTYLSAGLPNIEGEDTAIWFNQTNMVSGALGIGDSPRYNMQAFNNGSANWIRPLTLDASLSNPIYGASDTVQPPAACVRYMIKAFDGQTPDSALIDITQYAQDLANRLTREQTPAFNHRDVVTTSGTYTAPVTGWYRITVKGGGGGGSSGRGNYSTGNRGGGGGGEGGTTIGFEHMTAGDTVTVVIGAGGAGGANGGNSGINGGDSTVTVNNNTYTGNGGGGGTYTMAGAGGSGTIYGASGTYGAHSNYEQTGSSGGGNGGGIGAYGANDVGRDGVNGGGGGGGYSSSTSSTTVSTAGGAGGDGYVWFEYFDPSLN